MSVRSSKIGSESPKNDENVERGPLCHVAAALVPRGSQRDMRLAGQLSSQQLSGAPRQRMRVATGRSSRPCVARVRARPAAIGGSGDGFWIV